MLSVVSIVDKGHLSKGARTAISAALGLLEGKRVSVVVEEAKRRRSLPQNAFLHGVVLPAVWSELFVKNGAVCSIEDVKVYLKSEVGQLYKSIIDPDGEVKKVLRSTTELSTTEWEDWLTQIRAWAAGYQLTIPLPNELTNIGEKNEHVGESGSR